VMFLDEHALDLLAVAEPEKKLVCAVGRLDMLGDAGAEWHELLGERLTQAQWQIGHPLEGLGPADDDPAAQLLDAHARLATFRQPGAQLVHLQVEQRAPSIASQRQYAGSGQHTLNCNI